MTRQPPVYINSAASIHPPLDGVGECLPGKCLTAVEPDYKRLIPDATLRRRMSRIVRMGVAAGQACLQDAAGVSPEAILTATGMGCLADTEKFMNSLLDGDEERLTPTAFIQSTFNTVGAQLALLNGNQSYNTTYVHRTFSFESALLDALLLIREREAVDVLAGAMDEQTPTLYTVLQRLGCWKRAMAGEGAAFFLLSGRRTDGTLAILQDVELFSGDYGEQAIRERMERFLLAHDAAGARTLYPADYKRFCGEYPTAASFALWYACRELREAEGKRPVLVYNAFLDAHSFILLKPV
ncbi:MAG: beta-ketoacyl synthase chain length factor [Tannerellaceae bacterium]|jgi:hypothetical protein|nr:beta-ketoacyl synthase chain length factor [Tannerellaceae bacterium]